MKLLHLSIVVVAGWLASSVPASAQTRWVVVNGQRMSDAQVAYLEHRACSSIPNGHYWLNVHTGAWGYARNPRVQGYLGEACAPRHKSLSERGRLYYPGEIINRR